MKRLTGEWVRKAEADWRAAVGLVGQRPPMHDIVCFHCQQAAEKYMKAVLEELTEPFPKTHDLIRLLTLLRPHYPDLRSLRRGLAFLSRHAIDTRYPGESASKRQADAAR